MAIKRANSWGGTFTDDETSNDIWGSWYADTIFGNGGNDRIDADDGDDKVYGGSGDDLIKGGAGNDKIYGGADDDTLFGNDDNDIVDGGSGNDLLDGGRGNDDLRGGTGNDTLIDFSGTDLFDGGAGRDELNYSSFDGKINITLNGEAEGTARQFVFTSLYSGGPESWIEASPDETFSIEDVVGTRNNDRITGGDDANILEGRAGNDHLYGRGGNDVIDGGDGADWIDGGKGYDTMTGGLYSGDSFVFKNGETSMASIDMQGHRFIDKITDFSSGDNINLSDIDADINTAGNQDFHFTPGDHFTGRAGELQLTWTGLDQDMQTVLVEGDINGDARTDFMIEVHTYSGINFVF
jgi:Ca2+-binding RTX toxin-like protein